MNGGGTELSTDDIYAIALKFYRENKDKAFHPTYQMRIKMSALINHVKYGRNRAASSSGTNYGLFDVVGSDMRRAQDELREMEVEDAQKEFVRTLEESCREFDGYLEAVFIEQHEQQRDKRDKELAELERMKEEQERQKHEEEMKQRVFQENARRVEQENKLRALLNMQTLSQFREYALQQHPNSEKEQERLIAQLQQHHFHQYMITLYENSKKSSDQMINGDTETFNVASDALSHKEPVQNTALSQNVIHHSNEQRVFNGSVTPLPETTNSVALKTSTLPSDTIDVKGNCHDSVALPQWYSSRMVEMWVSNDINEFKAEFKSSNIRPSRSPSNSANSIPVLNSDSSSSDFILTVNSGEVVTIQVPVTFSVLQDHANALSNSTDYQGDSYLVWQFATDQHDIGFGISVSKASVKNANEETELLPVSRLDSHVHMHGGRIKLLPVSQASSVNQIEGDPSSELSSVAYVFLLRFDNSYSLWRNKVLYYRICYSAN